MAGISPKLADAQSVVAVLRGNRSEFDSLVQRYFTMVSMIGYARLRCRESAEDLAQEVFLRAYLNLNHLEPPSSFGPWIAQIARNLAIDWVKQRRRRSELILMIPMEEVSDERITPAQGVLTPMEIREQHQLVHDAIEELNPLQREIVLLHFVEQWSIKEIAERLAIHPGNVGRQLKRALNTMKWRFESMLRDSASAMRPDRPAVVRTMGLIAATAALPASTKATLFSGASMVGTTSGASHIGAPVADRIPAWLRVVPHALSAGGPAALVAKTATVVLLGLCLSFGVYHVVFGNPATNDAVKSAAQASVANGSEWRHSDQFAEVVPEESNPKPSRRKAREERRQETPPFHAAPEPTTIIASSVEKTGVAPRPEATTQMVKPAPDFELIMAVNNARRQNLQRIKTWEGKAWIEHRSYDSDQPAPDSKPRYKQVADVTFAVDREKNVLASKWFEHDSNLLFANILLTADGFYRYRGMKSGNPKSRLVIYPRGQQTMRAPDVGDAYGFDPLWFIEQPVYSDMTEDLIAFHANVANGQKGRPWQIPDGAFRIGELIVIEKTKGNSPWRYTFDMARGGNLITYQTGNADPHPLEVQMAYEQQDGVWVTSSYRRITHDKPVGDHHGQTRIEQVRLTQMRLNQPLDEATFGVGSLGVKADELIEDRSGQIAIINEGKVTRVPPGQELKLTNGPEEWEKYVRQTIVFTYPPLNDSEETTLRDILKETVAESTRYQREHEVEFARLRDEGTKLMGMESRRGTQEATELNTAVKSLNKRWADLEKPVSITLRELLHSRVDEIVKAAEQERRPALDAEIAKITPKMQEEMQAINYRVFDIARSCWAYASKNKDQFPSDLDELVSAATVKPEKLLNPRRPQDKYGFIYIKPNRDHFDGRALIAFEVYDRWPQHGIAAAFADGHSEWVGDETRFNRMIKATLIPEAIASASTSQPGQSSSPNLLLPDGRLSRSASSLSRVGDDWDRFVEQFINTYGLDASQKETAHSILRELKDEAAHYRVARREQFEEVDIRLKQLSVMPVSQAEPNSSFKQVLFDLREQRRALEQPIDDMFNRLKERLQTIPTKAQREAFATLEKAEGKSKVK